MPANQDDREERREGTTVTITQTQGDGTAETCSVTIHAITAEEVFRACSQAMLGIGFRPEHVQELFQ
jgi:hypothetical protein